MAESRSRYDDGFRTAFQFPEVALDAMEAFAPEVVEAHGADLDRMWQVSADIPDVALGPRRADAAWL